MPDPGLAADLGNRRASLALLKDKGLLRFRELRCLRRSQLLSQSGKLSRKLQLQTVQFSGGRAVDEVLWKAVRERQDGLKSKNTDLPAWDRRRPKFLSSGLMRCGCCGAGFSNISKNAFGGSAARNKGPAVCTNMRGIKHEDLRHLSFSMSIEAICDLHRQNGA